MKCWLRRAMWGTIVLGAIVLVADVLSIWFAWYVRGPRHEHLWLGQGIVTFTFPPDQPLRLHKSPLGGHRFDRPVEFFWWFPNYPDWTNRYGIPLWMFIAALGLLAAALWWGTRLPKAGCANCGYSLDGLRDDATCPECGSDRTQSGVRARSSAPSSG
ncbi:MAG: hypothetical protein U0573_13590 [Phycisphaerales bacterium]|nr:hypothetical protein [Planctomycetota bacterium]